MGKLPTKTGEFLGNFFDISIGQFLEVRLYEKTNVSANVVDMALKILIPLYIYILENMYSKIK